MFFQSFSRTISETLRSKILEIKDTAVNKVQGEYRNRNGDCDFGSGDSKRNREKDDEKQRCQGLAHKSPFSFSVQFTLIFHNR